MDTIEIMALADEVLGAKLERLYTLAEDGKFQQLALAVQRLEGEKESANKCSVCLGKPLPSGKDCVCNGKGTVTTELFGLRIEIIDLEDKLTTTEQERDNAIAALKLDKEQREQYIEDWVNGKHRKESD